MLTYTRKLVKTNFIPIQILIPAPAGIKTANLLSCARRAVPDLPDRLALGCPAMGAEVLEETEFEPFFTALAPKLGGKRVALFGSYGWGDGQWMRDWVQRADEAGAYIVHDAGLMVHETPDDAGLADCRALGTALAKA